MTFTLLIAEDDVAQARLLAKLAVEAGFDPQLMQDGNAALAELRANPPAALFTDLRLPGADGLALIAAARDVDPNMPVILATGYATAHNTVEAFHLGVTDVLLKPLELDAVRLTLKRLHDALGQRRRTRPRRHAVSRRDQQRQPRCTDPLAAVHSGQAPDAAGRHQGHRRRCAADSGFEPAAQVSAGRFRQDLFFRVQVFPIQVPPLRARRDDIASLAEYFLARHGRALNPAVRGIAPDVVERLRAYDWPGNVRELEGVIQRGLVLASGESLTLSDLPAEMRPAPAGAGGVPWSGDATLEEVEIYWIRHVLERCGGNRTQAARRLGIDPSTLWRKLKEADA